MALDSSLCGCNIEFISAVSPQQVDTQIGVATGRVFCGLIGHVEKRCEFALLGFTVNLAARLAAYASKSGVLVCPNTFREMRTMQAAALSVATPSSPMTIRFEALTPIKVKGSNDYLQIHNVSIDSHDFSHLDRAPREMPMVNMVIGRKNETAQILECLDSLKGIGGVIALIGDAGLGKTAVFNSLTQREDAGDVISCRVNSTSRSHAYAGIASMLRRIMERIRIHGKENAVEWEKILFGRLPGDLREHMSLLQTAFPAIFASTILTSENDSTDALSSSARSKNLEKLLVAVFALLLSPPIELSPKVVPRDHEWNLPTVSRPWLLAVDDAHNLDDESWKLILALKSELAMRVFVTMRPLQSNPPPAFVSTAFEAAESGIRSMQLLPLSISKSHRLMCAFLDASRIPGVVQNYIYDRSEGNPLFIQAVCRELVEKRIITVNAFGEVSSGQGDRPLALVIESLATPGTQQDHPSQLDNIAAAFLDDLPPNLALLAKVVSVMDELSDEAMLRLVHPVPSQLASLSSDITTLVNLGVFIETPSMFTPSGVAFAFRTSIFKDAAYRMLLHAHKTSLHSAALRFVLPRFLNTDLQWISLVAHHFRVIARDPEAIESLTPYVSLNTLYNVFIEAGRKAAHDGFQRDAEGFFKDAVCASELLRAGGGDASLLLQALNELHAILAVSLEVSSPELEKIRKEIMDVLEQLAHSMCGGEMCVEIRRRCICELARGHMSFLIDSNRTSEVAELKDKLEAASLGDDETLFEIHSRHAMILRSENELEKAEELSTMLLTTWKNRGCPKPEYVDTVPSLLRNVVSWAVTAADFAKAAENIDNLYSYLETTEMNNAEKRRTAVTVTGLAMALCAVNANKEANRLLVLARTLVPLHLLPYFPLQARWASFVETTSRLLIDGRGRDAPSARYDATSNAEDLAKLFKLPVAKVYFSEQVRVALRYGVLDKAAELVGIWTERALTSSSYDTPDLPRLRGELLRLHNRETDAEREFHASIEQATRMKWNLYALCARQSLAYLLVDQKRFVEAQDLLQSMLSEVEKAGAELVIRFFPGADDLQAMLESTRGNVGASNDNDNEDRQTLSC